MVFEYIKQKYIAFRKSEFAWHRSAIVIIYIGYILIPSYYKFTWQIPPTEALFKAEGELFIRPIPGRGSLTGLKTPNGESLFTCETTIGKNDDCIWDGKIEKSVEGKQATIYWYRQQYYLWICRDRLVELWVGNDAIVSRARTQKTFNTIKNVNMWLIPVSFLGCFVLDALIRMAFFRRREKQKEQ